MLNKILNLFYFPRLFIVKLINIYQKTLSMDHGPLKVFFPHGFCRFQPTCSEYGKQAILKHGIIIGGFMASWRVLRCNPWNKGGSDPVK
ncbi:MAG: membrane protein insertion efficiency factor YidD [Candidatus Falkowbacteria bacterium]